MTSEIFREEALRFSAASSSRFGNPTGVLPPSWHRITLLLSLFVLGLILFLFNVDLARKETVRGKLRIDGAEARIYALEPGLITKVLVKDGELVDIDQPVATIASERFMSNGAALSEATLAILEMERNTLKREKQSIELTTQLAIEEAQQRYHDAVRREAEIAAQITVAKRRLTIAHNRALDAEAFLAEGLIAESELNERNDAVAQLEQSVLQSEAQASAIRAEQGRIQLEKQQQSANLQRDLASIEQRLLQIDNQVTMTQSNATHVVHAPFAGRITALRARAGEQTASGQPLAIILPENSTLIAEAYVPSRAIGFLAPGQEVKLQYDAFPYQKFGIAYGEVTGVANTSQLPEEIGIPSQTGVPLYRVRIALAEQSMKAFSEDVPLQAGMELSADILLERRSLLEWILEPLRSR